MTGPKSVAGWGLMVASAAGACLPLVDGNYVGAPLLQIGGTVEFVDVPEDIFPPDFDLALVWMRTDDNPAGEDVTFVSVSRTEGRSVQSAGTFTMDLFSLPEPEDSWVGRLYIYFPNDGLTASWTESWSTAGIATKPTSVVACYNMAALVKNDDVPFVAQSQDQAVTGGWLSCAEEAAQRFLACELESMKDNGANLDDCAAAWRTKREEECGELPLVTDEPVDGLLRLRCGFAVEEVPYELTVARPGAEESPL
ncbi:MAG: hypothetical protein ACO3JL_13415 [Myxococcota bacterium]